MFSEITRIRPACARKPEAAMLIERTKPPPSSAMSCSYASAFSDGGFQQSEAAAVERGRRRVIHLVGGDFQHLVFQIDGVAGGPRLVAGLAVLRETAAAPRRRD